MPQKDQVRLLIDREFHNPVNPIALEYMTLHRCIARNIEMLVDLGLHRTEQIRRSSGGCLRMHGRHNMDETNVSRYSEAGDERRITQ